jgi:GT2 family glycosyltransferase
VTKKFGFVVLNYINYGETIECVESILTISGNNYCIVIVDNHSPNNSFDILSAKYKQWGNITVLPSGRNGGYSYGNNCGIRFLESINICDVVIATSDTLVVSKDILQQLEKLDTDDVGVVGPKVMNLTNDDENPMLFKADIGYVLNIHFPSLASILRNTYYTVTPFLKSAFRNHKDQRRKITLSSNVYMVHGCFLYLTRHYFKKCGYLDESLFMYGEEDIFAYNCLKSNLRVLYQPTIEIIHKNARSTPSMNNNSFKTINSKKSMKYLRKKLTLSTMLIHITKKWLLM